MAIIEVENLVKRYGGRAAVDGVGFTVEQGEIFGVLGPNGAGKTTTVECVEGLRSPDEGTIRVCGLDPRRDGGELRQVLGAQLQASELPDKITVGEAMELFGSFYRAPVDWRELIDALGLGDKLRTRFGRLSGGQKQRLSIALALVGGPRVAVLDELTTGLDPVARRDTWGLIERIRDRGVTILLVTHFMEEARRLCDRLAVIDAGRLVAIDTPAGLVARVDAPRCARFRPSEPLDPAVLAELSALAPVEQAGGEVVVAGADDVLLVVAATLAHHRVEVSDLRIEQTSLEDAFVALTGRPVEA